MELNQHPSLAACHACGEPREQLYRVKKSTAELCAECHEATCCQGCGEDLGRGASEHGYVTSVDGWLWHDECLSRSVTTLKEAAVLR